MNIAIKTVCHSHPVIIRKTNMTQTVCVFVCMSNTKVFDFELVFPLVNGWTETKIVRFINKQSFYSATTGFKTFILSSSYLFILV